MQLAPHYCRDALVTVALAAAANSHSRVGQSSIGMKKDAAAAGACMTGRQLGMPLQLQVRQG